MPFLFQELTWNHKHHPKIKAKYLMSVPPTLTNNEEYSAKHLGLLGPEVVNQHLVHARVRAEVDQVELTVVHLDSYKDILSSDQSMDEVSKSQNCHFYCLKTTSRLEMNSHFLQSLAAVLHVLTRPRHLLLPGHRHRRHDLLVLGEFLQQLLGVDVLLVGQHFP